MIVGCLPKVNERVNTSERFKEKSAIPTDTQEHWQIYLDYSDEQLKKEGDAKGKCKGKQQWRLCLEPYSPSRNFGSNVSF